MMEPTKRQKDLLRKVVRDYIKTARPVSSEFLKRKHKLSFSPATIRAEMKRLDEMGYLEQPHHSAGRIPTDKGYRFFVDELFRKENCFRQDLEILQEIKRLTKEIDDQIKTFQQITKKVADFTTDLMLTYLESERIIFKEGWEDTFHRPEFQDIDFLESFLEGIEFLEKNIDEFF